LDVALEIPEDLTLDINMMKVRELKLIKTMTGKSFEETVNSLRNGGLDVDIIHALSLVALRRVHPDATPEDAEEVNVMSLMNGVELPGSAPDPKGDAEPETP
jgi:hypothetical protein